MDGKERKKYELATLTGIRGQKYLLFVQGRESVPELAPNHGYGCIVGDGTSRGVIKAFEDTILSSNWQDLETMQVTHKLLNYLNRKKVKIELFGFIQDYELFAKGRFDLCISFTVEGYIKEEVIAILARGLKNYGVSEEDIDLGI